ncbi:GNAT family N-acetyltransferase [Virgibacillus necropolis]|uniref:N-acetyltransferase n=1 Tax=Virgibacillus necropolis TaxID=163877 RepID=A0A221M7C4_9BACI|nr:GNAT family N-acetyltransferase [Virgibacillus necropolis]ASN03541.1 N-acetyltransferase [Virgibacillus necropolis]
METVLIDTMQNKDAEQVLDIFKEGIETKNATFETKVPTWEAWDRDHISSCRIVARAGDQVIGWAALTPTSARRAYVGVAELSIYLRLSSAGKGLGSKLLASIIEESENEGFWTLKSGIFPENKASIALHEKFGFRVLGTEKRVGKMNGVWRDVVRMERRSMVVGV